MPKPLILLLCAVGSLSSQPVPVKAQQKPQKSVDQLIQAAVRGDKEAVQQLVVRASRGDVDAQYSLGTVYENGEGVPKDPIQAADWYRQAAARDHAGAQYSLGWMYETGTGVPKDSKQAFVWYKQAAERGSPEAQYTLGVAYETGKGMPKDPNQAAAWYKQAAERGYPGGQSGLDRLQKLVISLKPQGGVYVIPVLINDAITLNFVLDSGAADVSIPSDVVTTLMRAGTISAADFMDTQAYTLADGSTTKSNRFRIRSLKVGDRVLENVVASISDRNADLLLGQSFLGRFKSWSIDNMTHTLVLK
jgi:clan AA aspartic protease (TIGR02281 family)